MCISKHATISFSKKAAPLNLQFLAQKKKINPPFKSPNARIKYFLQKIHKKHRKNVREPYYADIQTRNKPGQPVQAPRKSQNQNF